MSLMKCLTFDPDLISLCLGNKRHTSACKLIIKYDQTLQFFQFKVSVKENEVSTEKNSSRPSIFATKASYISN